MNQNYWETENFHLFLNIGTQVTAADLSPPPRKSPNFRNTTGYRRILEIPREIAEFSKIRELVFMNFEVFNLSISID